MTIMHSMNPMAVKQTTTLSPKKLSHLLRECRNEMVSNSAFFVLHPVIIIKPFKKLYIIFKRMK